MIPILQLLFAVVIWGWSFVATKICLGHLSPADLLGLRMLIALPILFVLTKVKRVPFDLDASTIRRMALGSLIITAHFLIQITGIKYTTATNTGWIISVTPLVTVVLSYFFLREKIHLSQLIGIVVATTGILLLVSRGKIGDLDWLKSTGDWLVLASAHTWAIYTVVTRDLARSRPPLLVTLGVLLPTAVVMLGYMLLFSDWSSFLHLPTDVIVALLVLSVLATALAHWFWQEGVAGLGAARAGIFLYLEPIATTTLAVPLLKEPFGTLSALGGALVLLGVYIAQRQRGKNR